ncbi:MAG: DUF86 domain-containing protein [Tepidisphaeraceae bacterium]|jgi:uncharacterized protein with HEPN domain
MKGDALYLNHILDAIDTINRYISVGQKQFMAESHWQDATVRQLEIIGEATKKLSEPLRKRYPDIPWRRIAGLRDVLIHRYMGVDLDSVWEVAHKDLPELRRKIEDIAREMP